MNLGFRLFFILLFLYLPLMMFSQSQPSGRAEKYHSKALMYYNASAYDEALEAVQKVLKINDR